MTRYSLLLDKKGTIVSFNVIDADPSRFPVTDMTGYHFSRLVGEDCKKTLRSIFQRISKTHLPANFITYLRPKGARESPVLEWTVYPKAKGIFNTERYLMTGKDPE